MGVWFEQRAYGDVGGMQSRIQGESGRIKEISETRSRSFADRVTMWYYRVIRHVPHGLRGDSADQNATFSVVIGDDGDIRKSHTEPSILFLFT